MTSRKSRRLATQVAELSMAVPQVMTHRLSRMAASGGHPSAADRREAWTMVVEKPFAFGQGWLAVAMQAWQLQQQWMLGLARTWWPSNLGSTLNPWQIGTSLMKAQVALTSAAIKPIHGRATANARRLNGRRRPS